MISTVLSPIHSIDDEQLEKQVPEVASRSDGSEDGRLLQVVWVGSKAVDEIVVVQHVARDEREMRRGFRGRDDGDGRGKDETRRLTPSESSRWRDRTLQIGRSCSSERSSI